MTVVYIILSLCKHECICKKVSVRIMHALTNIEIHNILYNDKFTKKIYKGQIIARENHQIKKIIKNLKTPSLVLYNTDKKESIGMHWLIIFYDKNKTIFFDPLGYSPTMYAFPYIVSRKRLPVIMNPSNVQHLKNSSLCGHFCVLYSLLLARKFKLKKINDFFSEDIKLNEAIIIPILKWVKKRLI